MMLTKMWEPQLPKLRLCMTEALFLRVVILEIHEILDHVIKPVALKAGASYCQRWAILMPMLSNKGG